MTEFKITEPGSYKQANGGKAEYVGRDSNGRYIGLDSDSDFACWSIDGAHSAWNEFNLIAPWTEPKKVMVDFWVNVYASGGSDIWLNRGEADKCADCTRIACIHFKREVTEGEGL